MIARIQGSDIDIELTDRRQWLSRSDSLKSRWWARKLRLLVDPDMIPVGRVQPFSGYAAVERAERMLEEYGEIVSVALQEIPFVPGEIY